MTRCEVCGRPATHTCSGLDVPRLWFCAEHADEHQRICPYIYDKRAQMSEPKADRATHREPR
jgi:hypothetical protein